MTIAPLLILALGAFWIFLCWRVRVEKGSVGTPPTALQIATREWLRRLVEMYVVLGEALLPAVRKACAAAAEFGERFRGVVAETETTVSLELPDVIPPC